MNATIHKARVVNFGCQDTRKNLPAPVAGKRGEGHFLARFERAYCAHELSGKSSQKQFAAGREFAVDGFGRADLLFMAWKPSPAAEDFSALALKNSLRLTAIEAKLKDWRKGLMQASRYRFFANRALLVLPPESAKVAKAFLGTFKLLHVGLWEFDAEKSILRKHFTPRCERPLNEKARAKAVHVISRKLKLG